MDLNGNRIYAFKSIARLSSNRPRPERQIHTRYAWMLIGTAGTGLVSMQHHRYTLSSGSALLGYPGTIALQAEKQDAGLEMEYTIRVNERLATNLPGIFAAGDTANYPSKLKLIAGAFNDAAVAVNGAKLYLEPAASSMAYVSSHNGKFNELNKVLRKSKDNE